MSSSRQERASLRHDELEEEETATRPGEDVEGPDETVGVVKPLSVEVAEHG